MVKVDIYNNFVNVKYGDNMNASIFKVFKQHCSYVEYMGSKTYSVVYQGKGLEIKVV